MLDLPLAMPNLTGFSWSGVDQHQLTARQVDWLFESGSLTRCIERWFEGYIDSTLSVNEPEILAAETDYWLREIVLY